MATTKAKPLAVCKLNVGDIYSHLLQYSREKLIRREANLSGDSTPDSSLIFPAPQEVSLFRPLKTSATVQGEIFDAIGEELGAIRKKYGDDIVNMYSSDSSDSDSDSSFLDDGTTVKKEDLGSIVTANERLFGSISLSFFPVPW